MSGTRPSTTRLGRAAPPLAALAGANVVIWLWAWAALRGDPMLLGTALLAWLFGLRHALDADHIAAIDNVVRKLVDVRRRAWDCGLWFALGHSGVVLLLCLAAIGLPTTSGMERWRDTAVDWGTAISVIFLALIGLINLSRLPRLWRAGAPARFAPGGGLLSRALGPVSELVARSWHMLPVGLLFALGFDTASEVALLALTGREAASGLSLSGVLVFPALFAAGMVLIDTADSVAMTGAYRWASRDRRRTRLYTLTVTAISAMAALAIAGVELLGAVAPGAGRVGRLLLDALPFAGFGLAGLLLSIWAYAMLVWRRRPEERASIGK